MLLFVSIIVREQCAKPAERASDVSPSREAGVRIAKPTPAPAGGVITFQVKQIAAAPEGRPNRLHSKFFLIHAIPLGYQPKNGTAAPQTSYPQLS
jgi:hypothetical protein